MKTSTITAAVLAFVSLSFAAPGKRQAPPFGFPTPPTTSPASSDCIVQSVNGPDAAQVVASIDQWNTDVQTVNSFLNDAGDLIASGQTAELLSRAQQALTNAQDEPCQLQTLSTTPGLTDGLAPAAFSCAVSDLTAGFGPNVITNLQTIVDGPDNTAAVQTAINSINQFRCCHVLGDASILWLDASTQAGVEDQVNTVAPQEDACNAIQCTNACGAMDNGPFGTPGDLTSIGGA